MIKARSAQSFQLLPAASSCVQLLPAASSFCRAFRGGCDKEDPLAEASAAEQHVPGLLDYRVPRPAEAAGVSAIAVLTDERSSHAPTYLISVLATIGRVGLRL